MMEKRIIDMLAEVRQTQTSHERKEWSRSGHTSGGSGSGVHWLVPRLPP